MTRPMKILRATPPPSLPIPGGGSVEVRGEGVELRDTEGRLLLRYCHGSVEIAAPKGDLVLAAPEGRVVVRSGQDVEIEAARDLVQRAGRDVEVRAGEEGSRLRMGSADVALETERLEVKAGDSHVVTGQATVIARRIATTAGVITQSVERFELAATRIVERARDALRETSELSETRAGRVRTLVKDLYAVVSRRTTMSSTEDTAIDGSKILLG